MVGLQTVKTLTWDSWQEETVAEKGESHQAGLERPNLTLQARFTPSTTFPFEVGYAGSSFLSHFFPEGWEIPQWVVYRTCMSKAHTNP